MMQTCATIADIMQMCLPPSSSSTAGLHDQLCCSEPVVTGTISHAQEEVN